MVDHDPISNQKRSLDMVERNARLKRVMDEYDAACKKARDEYSAGVEVLEARYNRKVKRALTKFEKEYR